MTFSNGPFHMVVPTLADQQELTYNYSVRTQDVSLENLSGAMNDRDEKRERERELGKSVQAAQHKLMMMMMMMMKMKYIKCFYLFFTSQ